MSPEHVMHRDTYYMGSQQRYEAARERVSRVASWARELDLQDSVHAREPRSYNGLVTFPIT